MTSRFRTAPADEDSRFSFAVVGDSGDGGRVQLEVAGLLGRLRPDLILHAGDVVYPRGAEKDYDKRFFAPYRALIKEVPIFPVLGNHDVLHRNGAAFLDNFHPPLHSHGSTKRYYSFDWGGAHFVALDSDSTTTTGRLAPRNRRPSWSKTSPPRSSAGSSPSCTGPSIALQGTAPTRR